jgi:hypothetical protein
LSALRRIVGIESNLNGLLTASRAIRCIPDICIIYITFQQTGMRVVFELKKEVQTAATYQAMVTLLLANYHAPRYVHIFVFEQAQLLLQHNRELDCRSSYSILSDAEATTDSSFSTALRCSAFSYKPIVILTDLRDAYIFYWLDGRTIYYSEVESAACAWGLLDAFLQGEHMDMAAGCLLPNADAAGFPPAKRRRFELDAPVTHSTSLQDLDAYSDPRACTLVQYLQSFVALPAVSAARKSYIDMYA